MEVGSEKRSVMSSFHQVAGRILGRTICQLSRDQGMVAGEAHGELESRIDVLDSWWLIED